MCRRMSHWSSETNRFVSEEVCAYEEMCVELVNMYVILL